MLDGEAGFGFDHEGDAVLLGQGEDFAETGFRSGRGRGLSLRSPRGPAGFERDGFSAEGGGHVEGVFGVVDAAACAEASSSSIQVG